MSEYKSWDELTRKEQLAGEYSDFYKSVHGVRPRWLDMDEMSEEEIEEAMELLGKQAEVVFAREAAEEKLAVEKFEQHVTNTICMGARDRVTALRWIMDASTANGDWEYFCFLNGLPYGYFNTTV